MTKKHSCFTLNGLSSSHLYSHPCWKCEDPFTITDSQETLALGMAAVHSYGQAVCIYRSGVIIVGTIFCIPSFDHIIPWISMSHHNSEPSRRMSILMGSIIHLDEGLDDWLLLCSQSSVKYSQQNKYDSLKDFYLVLFSWDSVFWTWRNYHAPTKLIKNGMERLEVQQKPESLGKKRERSREYKKPSSYFQIN